MVPRARIVLCCLSSALTAGRLPGRPRPCRRAREPTSRSYRRGEAARRAGRVVPGYDTLQRDGGTGLPDYAGSVESMRGAGPAARRAWPCGALAHPGDRGPDPAPVWRSPWRRRAARAGLCAATVLAGAVSLLSLTGVAAVPLAWPPCRPCFEGCPGERHARVGAERRRSCRAPMLFHPGWRAFAGPAVWSVIAVLIALAVVAPVPLAARYPLLGWRIAWTGMLLVPLAGIRWWGGGPWSPVQMPGPAAGVLRGRDPPSPAGAVVDVGPEPDPLVPPGEQGRTGRDRLHRGRRRVHRGRGGGGCRRLAPAC